MRVTNNFNLPETIVNAVRNDDYSKGDADYSCTELINSVRITLLRQRHENDIVEDTTERIWSLVGRIGHGIAEKAGADNALVEERLFAEVGGKKISGAMDLASWVYADGKITDYKFTSIFVRKYLSDHIEGWEQQQNIYAWLLRQYGFRVGKLEICAVYRDWRNGESRKEGRQYPPRAEIIPLKLWAEQEQEHFIRNRLAALVMAEGVPDDLLPACTPEEMWEKPTTYAVMKDGAKRATRVLETRIDAIAHASGLKGKYEVVERPGRRTRCEEYCSVNQFCNSYLEYAERSNP